MENQSSCRSNRPGYTGSGRSMSGYGPRRPMPYSGRSMYNSDRNRSSCGSQTDARTLSSDAICEQRQSNNCCDMDTKTVTCVANANFPAGMAYVPMQKWGPLYDHEKALCQGTLFPELDKPFMGRRAAR